jgi:hypothetical protein
MSQTVNVDFCESCESSFLGLSGSTKWCPYCGAKHEGATVPYTFPAAKWTDFDRTEKNNPPFGKEVLVKYSARWPNDEKVFITGGTLHNSDNCLSYMVQRSRRSHVRHSSFLV